MDPDQLTPVHLVALASHREALIALDRVCDLAAEEVSRQWNKGTPRGRYPPTGVRREAWWGYPPNRRGEAAPARIGHWQFWWQLFDDASYILRGGAPGVPFFTVQMIASADQEAIAALNPTTTEQLERRGFQILPLGATKSRGNEYLWQMAYPEEVLAGRDLVSQGGSLARWVVDGFSALHTALTDAGSQA